jgi:hypothetical protein
MKSRGAGLDSLKAFGKLTSMSEATTQPANGFTKRYFYDEIVRFRECFGNKEWWKLAEAKREACVRALCYVYTNVVNDDGSHPKQEMIDSLAVTLDATVIEYERRKMYHQMLGRAA